jgi:hypothetical protein
MNKQKIKEKDVVHKIVPIKGNFIDYLLKKDPNLPNRMLENSIREDERKKFENKIKELEDKNKSLVDAYQKRLAEFLMEKGELEKEIEEDR